MADSDYSVLIEGTKASHHLTNHRSMTSPGTENQQHTQHQLAPTPLLTYRRLGHGVSEVSTCLLGFITLLVAWPQP